MASRSGRADPPHRTGGEPRTWESTVLEFSAKLAQQTSMGDDRRRRILYEIRRTPSLLRRVGAASLPSSPRQLRREHLVALRRGLPWAPGTLAIHFGALRGFARWARNPLASDREAWAVPAGSPTRRRWLKSEELAALFQASSGKERLLIALEGFNGLRRVEVLRLRWQDVDLTNGRLRVLGKGRYGGKWRVVPMFPLTQGVLKSAVRADAPQSRVIDLARTAADLLLQRAVTRAGLLQGGRRVSHHDLRRTFGRLANEAGMDLVQLKNLYGHSSLDQTVHYIGLDEDRMRKGLERLAQFLSPVMGNACL